MIRRQPIPRHPVDPLVLALLVVALLVALAHAAPTSAATIDCGEEPQGTVIRFVTFPGIEVPSEPGDQCSDTFQCGEPVVTGSMIDKADPTCDPEIEACAVRLRFSLTFRSNRESIDDVGLFGAPTPRTAIARRGSLLFGHPKCGLSIGLSRSTREPPRVGGPRSGHCLAGRGPEPARPAVGTGCHRLARRRTSAPSSGRRSGLDFRWGPCLIRELGRVRTNPLLRDSEERKLKEVAHGADGKA